MKDRYAPGVSRNTPPIATAFDDGNKQADNVAGFAHTVIITGKKTAYWEKAVAEWAAHNNIPLVVTPLPHTRENAVEYAFTQRKHAHDFCSEAFGKHSFDVEAREIERRDAGVRLEQADSVIDWAPSLVRRS